VVFKHRNSFTVTLNCVDFETICIFRIIKEIHDRKLLWRSKWMRQ
jgi:hypothetical protein